jgi:four helix bundle protein
MAFDAYDRSLDLLRALVPLLKRLDSIDPKLADQLRRASQSATLNISEGNRRTGRDRRNRFRCALGSAAESASCLEVAVALGYVDDATISPVLALIDRIRAMTYRMSS